MAWYLLFTFIPLNLGSQNFQEISLNKMMSTVCQSITTKVWNLYLETRNKASAVYFFNCFILYLVKPKMLSLLFLLCLQVSKQMEASGQQQQSKGKVKHPFLQPQKLCLVEAQLLTTAKEFRGKGNTVIPVCNYFSSLWNGFQKICKCYLSTWLKMTSSPSLKENHR